MNPRAELEFAVLGSIVFNKRFTDKYQIDCLLVGPCRFIKPEPHVIKKLIRRHGFGKEIALVLVAAVQLQKVHLRLCFNAFGNHGKPDTFRQHNDRIDDRRIILVGRDVVHKRLVNQGIDGAGSGAIDQNAFSEFKLQVFGIQTGCSQGIGHQRKIFIDPDFGLSAASAPTILPLILSTSGG